MISFFNEHPDFCLYKRRAIKKWILEICTSHSSSIDKLHYYFLTDEELMKLNITYLNHHTYTDIISFDYSSNNIISGEIFISIDRVRENSIKFKQSFEIELLRVLIHGVLHFLGYKDKTKKEKQNMREAEHRTITKFYEMFPVEHSNF